MSKMVQVRNIPDKLHRELVRRAKKQGKTLTDYIRGILEREVARPPMDEVLERIRKRPRVKLDTPVSEYIRDERAEREERLWPS